MEQSGRTHPWWAKWKLSTSPTPARWANKATTTSRADPAAARTAVPAGVEQGKLENSNTGAADAAVRLISVMRQFEMLQKAAGLANDMSQKAINEVAKVGS